MVWFIDFVRDNVSIVTKCYATICILYYAAQLYVSCNVNQIHIDFRLIEIVHKVLQNYDFIVFAELDMDFYYRKIDYYE